jgi:hypothetical protein
VTPPPSAVDPQAPAVHTCPAVVQSVQVLPERPHAVSWLPAWHVPLESQHPLQVPPSAQDPLPDPLLLVELAPELPPAPELPLAPELPPVPELPPTPELPEPPELAPLDEPLLVAEPPPSVDPPLAPELLLPYIDASPPPFPLVELDPQATAMSASSAGAPNPLIFITPLPTSLSLWTRKWITRLRLVPVSDGVSSG